MQWLALIAVAGVLVACGNSKPEPAAAAGQITGQVSAGPLTPVSRPGQPASRPVDGALVEAMRGTDKVAVTRTDHAGRYQMALQPGTYVIAVSHAGYLRSVPALRTVTVIAGHRQTVDFTLDTGIR